MIQSECSLIMKMYFLSTNRMMGISSLQVEGDRIPIVSLVIIAPEHSEMELRP